MCPQPQGYDKPFDWLCECGQRGCANDGFWRWHKDRWEHQHMEPVNFVPARYAPLPEREEEDA